MLERGTGVANKSEVGGQNILAQGPSGNGKEGGAMSTDTVLTNRKLVKRLQTIGVETEWGLCRNREECRVYLDDLLAYCKRKGWSVAARNGIDGGWCASVGGNSVHYSEGPTLIRALALAVLDAAGRQP